MTPPTKTPVNNMKTKTEVNTEAIVDETKQNKIKCKFCKKSFNNKQIKNHENFQCQETRCTICNKKIEEKMN